MCVRHTSSFFKKINNRYPPLRSRLTARLEVRIPAKCIFFIYNRTSHLFSAIRRYRLFHMIFSRDKLNVFEGASGSKVGKEKPGNRSSVGALHGRGLVTAWAKVSCRKHYCTGLRSFGGRLASTLLGSSAQTNCRVVLPFLPRKDLRCRMLPIQQVAARRRPASVTFPEATITFYQIEAIHPSFFYPIHIICAECATKMTVKEILTVKNFPRGSRSSPVDDNEATQPFASVPLSFDIFSLSSAHFLYFVVLL